MHTLVSNNVAQFNAMLITVICRAYEIKQHLSAPYHPKGNGQVEATNKNLLGILKIRLKEAKGKWVEELPAMLWDYRITPKHSIGFPPSIYHLALRQSYLPNLCFQPLEQS